MATNRINQLYQEKRNTWNEANLISQKYDADSNPMSADDKAKFERYIDDVKDIEAQIKTQEDFEKLSAEKSERIEVDGEKRETVEEKEKTHAELIDKWMRSPRSLTPDERKLVNLGQHEGNPSLELRSVDQSTTTTEGGYTIDTTLANYIERAKIFYGGMFEAPTWIRTSKGGTMYFPTVNDTGNTGAKETEGGDMFTSSTGITFAQDQLDSYIYSSEGITVSNQVLQDSEFNLAQFVGSILGERLYRKVNTDLTAANGSSLPNGINYAATLSSNIANNAITRTNLLGLIYDVDKAYRMGSKTGFMFHDSFEKALMLLTIGAADDRPLWQPSMREGAPATVEGYKYWINNDIDELTASTSSKSVFFGDWSKYIAREVVPLRVVRLVERYAELDAVGFIVIGRYDGDLIAGTSSYPLKYLRNYGT